ncbi:antibiotic biosynthesis monooxygenase [Paenibacillus sp. HJL G12]|uniref:Antibiotic biosynthesis monooxygenase n=1 Tax=Paenibacillus dendrobii TaxID=2691084 RepID=A0A7X3IGL1_9BACL|nr:antibiotic biosynthesis monooxygenase [Paenibacillus dendrobii]MWV43168.1 antibiotic biosynthesis monooxygenase [Paenibacillus dendrobii]
MLIQLRKIVVTAGNADQVVARFSKEGAVNSMEGFIDKTVMVSKISREEEEVVVMIRWESRDAWKNWEKSDVHLQGHRDKKGQEPPAYILSTKVSMYDVQSVTEAKAVSN